MMGKQYILDIVIVLLVPVLIIGGYYYWWRPDNSALLEVSDLSQIEEGTVGARVVEALQTLQSITIDDTLFHDPMFLWLKEFPVVIPTVPLSRPNPFIPSPEVIEMLQSAKSVSSRSPTAGTVTSISTVLDRLKK